MFVLIYWNQDNYAIIYQKVLLRIINNIIINGKNFDDQAIDSDIKQNKEIRKLTTVQGEYYTQDVCGIMITSKIIID